MKRKEDSFEDIAFELEKETSKSKFLPFVLLAIIGFSIVGAVFLMLSIPEKAKSKQPVSQSSKIISPSKELEDKETEVKKFVESLIVSLEKSGPFLWTVDKAVSLPMDKDKGGVVLEDVLKEFGKPVEAGSWIDFSSNNEIQKHIRLFWKEKNGALGYVSLTFAEFDGVYKLISKYHSNLASDEIKVDKILIETFYGRKNILIVLLLVLEKVLTKVRFIMRSFQILAYLYIRRFWERINNFKCGLLITIQGDGDLQMN